MHPEDNLIIENSASENDPNFFHGRQETNPLKGEELLNYIEQQKNLTEENGDLICIGAGYGSNTKEGETICRLDLFSQELINAKQETHLKYHGKEARKQILNSYDLNTLQKIVDQGCVSGAAYLHLQIADNEMFFDQNREELTTYLEDQFGPKYLKSSAERVGGNHSHWKHRAVWRFIELVALEEVERLR